MIPRRAEKIKSFLSVVIYVVKAAFALFLAIGANPTNAGVARLCDVSPYPVPDTATALPNVAPYQLSYTRIFDFSSYHHDKGKNKDFSICGHLCGQSRFYTAFSNRGKSRKRRRHKTLRRFASPYPGYNHGTPKYGAVPAPLYPGFKKYAARFRAAYLLYQFFGLLARGNFAASYRPRAAFKASARSVFSQATPKSSRPMWP